MSALPTREPQTLPARIAVYGQISQPVAHVFLARRCLVSYLIGGLRELFPIIRHFFGTSHAPGCCFPADTDRAVGPDGLFRTICERAGNSSANPARSRTGYNGSFRTRSACNARGVGNTHLRPGSDPSNSRGWDRNPGAGESGHGNPAAHAQLCHGHAGSHTRNPRQYSGECSVKFWGDRLGPCAYRRSHGHRSKRGPTGFARRRPGGESLSIYPAQRLPRLSFTGHLPGRTQHGAGILPGILVNPLPRATGRVAAAV